MEKYNLLVVDDEKEMLVSYEKVLTRAGYAVQCFDRAEEALQYLEKGDGVSLIICDLKMPGMDGMRFLSEVKRRHAYLPVIMVTGFGTVESAIEAVKKGAFDFIEKPFSKKKLLSSVEKALNQIVGSAIVNGVKDEYMGMVGRGPAMKKIFEMIEKVALGQANVLITGESGVGKELVAHAIHKRSLRRNRPLIPINCGALPDTLFESELFGYEKGAFTGAFQSKPGLVELAHGGTLFLDEICEMSQALQVKLLRMLESRKIRRIGGKEEIAVDVRVISATNRDAEEMVKKGVLREDLFYRINTIRIVVPPLRERPEDIPALVQHFLSVLNQKYDRQITGVDEQALMYLQQYHWPGNVRELQNVMERAYYMAEPPLIRTTDLPEIGDRAMPLKGQRWEGLRYGDAKEKAIEEFEREYLIYHLHRNDWNISRTAESCGMDRRTVHRLIKRYDLK